MTAPIRAKEGTYQLTVDGQRMGGSFVKIKDVVIRPDAEIVKRRYAGEKRFAPDLDVKGYDFSFKTAKADHLWWTVWRKFEAAENAGGPYPVVSLAVTARYRDGTGNLRTVTLHGDLVMKIDEDTAGPENGDQEVSYSGSCSFASGV